MSKVWSDDKSLFSTFGRSKDGTHTATVYMADAGENYPAFGIEAADGFQSRGEAKRWAQMRMDASA